MADGPFRFQAGAGQHYFQQYNQQQQPRHPQRAASPVGGGRLPFDLDTPSPTRTPGLQAVADSYNMFNQNHGGNQHGLLNGAGQNRFGMPMNVNKPFQHQTHHHGHQQAHHQDHTAHNQHGAPFGHHQHTHSGGALTGAAAHFNTTHATGSTPNNAYNAAAKAPNEHWALQLQLAQQSREMTMQHPHARLASSSSKTTAISFTNGINKETDKEERGRATMEDESLQDQTWTALDMGGQNLKVMHGSILQYHFLTKLYLNHNKISFIPPTIGRLRGLTVLDLSQNELRELPPEIGMLVNLREFFLFDNHLETLPFEMGTLYQLQILGIEGNPLDEDLKSIIMEQGTGALIKYMRENAEPPSPPNERDWIQLDDSTIPAEEKFTALSFNILCDKYATQTQHGYTPSQALSWDHRRELILDELRARDADIVCLQEVDMDSYSEYFRPNLAQEYKSVFWTKTRAKTMGEREAKRVDGCAIFYKHKKYMCLDKQLIDFRNTAINRPDMKAEHDIFNRVMPRDDIAVAAFLENRRTGARLAVANVHIFWDPRYKDVKVIQAAILVDQLGKLAEKWANLGPTSDKDKLTFKYENGDEPDAQVDGAEEVSQEPVPSQSYANASALPLIVCGDFNSMPNSGVYDLIAHGSLSHLHEDLGDHKYGDFTKQGMTHPFSLRSSYSHIGELKFTNYTPTYVGVLDYIWYSTNALQVTGLLGDVDEEYLQRVPGFPNWHFPSDHLPLLAEFAVKSRKEAKVVEADFGPSSQRRQQQ